MKKTILIVLALAGFAVQNGAADGGGFADFRKQKQAEILAAIDNSLATQAEKAISDNFAAVRKADVQVQTGVGGRNGNVGLNLIGAFAETDSHAFGWQLRAYGGRDIDSGANAGVFYRNIGGGFLLGGNAFADYEKHKYGEFVRYSLGMEVQNDIVAFAANYYIPLTDNKKVNVTLAAFSRQGYDGKLRIAAPRFRRIKAAVDYYHFVGEGDTAKENGFRYGMEWHPTPALRLNLFYDDGGEKFGGDIAYAWTLGETQARQNGGETFAPDMFAAVSREYSQRIATVAAVGISLRISIVGIMTNAMTIPAITTTTGMTAAAITTTTTITTPPMMTIMTMFPVMTAATRMANVHFTISLDINHPLLNLNYYYLATTQQRHLVTLPVSSGRPILITTEREYAVNNRNVIVVTSVGQGAIPPGITLGLGGGRILLTLIIAEGSEEFISVTTTLTTRTTTTIAAVITETPMTMAAVSTTTTMTAAAISTTTRITTFSTMTILLTANTAMADSRFRGNDERGGSYEMAVLERGGNDKQPSFPRKRESKPLSFVYLRDSANGDLSPQMANRRVRKAHS